MIKTALCTGCKRYDKRDFTVSGSTMFAWWVTFDNGDSAQTHTKRPDAPRFEEGRKYKYDLIEEEKETSGEKWIAKKIKFVAKIVEEIKDDRGTVERADMPFKAKVIATSIYSSIAFIQSNKVPASLDNIFALSKLIDAWIMENDNTDDIDIRKLLVSSLTSSNISFLRWDEAKAFLTIIETWVKECKDVQDRIVRLSAVKQAMNLSLVETAFPGTENFINTVSMFYNNMA